MPCDEGKTILIVEDDSDLRETIEEILSDEFVVLSAADGREALAIMEKKRPDLVLSDVGMPRLSGFEMLEAMRAAKETESVPVIILSAKGDRENIRRGMELGADDYIPKPFRTDELLAAVQSRLSRQSAFRRPMYDLQETLSLSLPHEFRTPLNGILGFGSLIQDMAKDPAPIDREELSEFASQVVTSGTRLLHLVEKFTFHARLLATSHAGNGDVESHERSAPGWTSAISEQATAMASQLCRCEDLTVDIVAADIGVETTYISHLVGELLENAFIYSEPGRPVLVRGAVAGDTYRISVSDHGRGMTPRQVENIGPYVQFNRKYHEQQGLGLGLATVSQITHLHGGTMSIRSEPGEGTIVEVELPLARD